ncbi:MAG: hypothetical protein MK089_04305 [Phycisphaerales bacterium]|nr:hypothetical protein [Phycisphaerales bacterium]
MMNPNDILARQAAALLRDGRAATITEAIKQARSSPDSPPDARTGPAQVRRHLEAMSMAREGWAEWHLQKQSRLEEVEQFLALLEHLFDQFEVRIAGRAARGEVDPGDRVHLRLWVDQDLSEVMEALEVAGVPEHGSRSVRAEAACGVTRLATLNYPGETIEIVVTLCPQREIATSTLNLTTGATVSTATPAAFRRLLGDSGAE